MHERLLTILNGVGTPRVLLAGDFMLDHYTYGNTDRISPEAPVVIINVTERQERPGGAGSVAVDLAALGAKVACLGVVGQDANGQKLRAMLATLDGVDVSGLLEDADRPTTSKQRIIGLAQHRHRQQLMRIDEESSQPVSPATQERLWARFIQLLDESDVVCLEDYNKGVLGEAFCRRVIQAANQRARKVIVDPGAVGDYGRYADAWMIKPNRRELALASGIELNDDESGWRQAADKVARTCRIDNVVVTLDKRGALLYRRNEPPEGRAEVIPTRPRNVYDVTGAGDMVLAMLGLLAGGRYADQDPPTVGEMVRLANIAGGLEVERFGSVGISRAEIVAELARERSVKTGKLRSRPALLEELQWHRQQNHRIVFTNGCYDLLHPGHVYLLHFAKQQGDILILAINSDRSVRQLKGPTRPILSEQERAAILSGLEAVDYITIFDEPDPGPLIELITPDVLLKGSDWTGNVVGQEWVEAHGGKVVLVPLYQGVSTTQIIERIRERQDRRPEHSGNSHG
ncbi:MAG: bifunctional heptose 7-phosphate kinase/heptose 1-phosphate adenyltransferase [Sedimentisphaerales bacterium]|nr:bifunctional heptose 7-phosphate kinase/heptose 1-phosphate adenyltransferase [Sedimentisphaerales bacterium]